MEDGVISETGQNALLYVEEESRREAEPVIILLHLTVVLIVKEKLRTHKNATLTLAPVRKKIAISCFWSFTLITEK